jgi:hypothetical protein
MGNAKLSIGYSGFASFWIIQILKLKSEINRKFVLHSCESFAKSLRK